MGVVVLTKISGGSSASRLAAGDGDFFDIDNGGNLTFTQPPDFENPADEDGNNRYEFHLHVYDTNPPGGRSSSTFFSVTVIVEDSRLNHWRLMVQPLSNTRRTHG